MVVDEVRSSIEPRYTRSAIDRSFGLPDPVADHLDSSVGREGGAFLPGQQMAAVIAGKIDAFIGLEKSVVGAFVIFTACA